MIEEALGHRPSIFAIKPAESDSILFKERRDKAEQVKRITQRLYTLKPNPAYIAEHRATKSQVLNLRQVTRNSKERTPHPSLSTIHNLSMDMVAAIKGARVRRSSAEETEALPQFLPRQHSLQLQPSRPNSGLLGPAGTQLRHLTSQMHQVLSLSLTLLPSHPPTKPPGRHSLEVVTETPALRFPKQAAGQVKTQLQEDLKGLNQKLRLVVSSLLLLEEDLKECGEVSQEKRKVLQKRANSLYALLDFLRKVRERAADYVKRIEGALSRVGLMGEEGKHTSLAADILAMTHKGRAIEFITEAVEVPPLLSLTKKELMKYERVSFAKVLPRLMGRKNRLQSL